LQIFITIWQRGDLYANILSLIILDNNEMSLTIRKFSFK
jgi:hypothetical protein